MGVGSNRAIGVALRLVALVVATFVVLSSARAEIVLRWASAGGALTFDPHGHNVTPTHAIQHQVYEPLVLLGHDLALEPALATAWALVDATTWEFALRRGVRFHDGSGFTADDVVFSLNRARAETSDIKHWFVTVADVQATGQYTVRITTSRPDMILPVRLNRTMIMSRAWAAGHGVAAPSRPNDAQEGYTLRHANGTGPFRLEEFEPNGRFVMARNPDWWNLHSGNVDRIIHEAIPDPDERMAAILDGDIDFLLDPPFAALERIRATPGFKLEQTTEFRTIFLALDQGSRELRSSNVRGRNPFHDRRVRQAMYQAIDIERIRDEVMQALALPAGMIIEPGVNGYSPDLDRRLSYDPGAARQLLAQAGYADGFSVTLDCPNNRYANDEAICHVVASQLGEVGIAVAVDAKPMNEHSAKLFDRQTDFYLFGWGGGGFILDSVDTLRGWYHTAGGGNRFNVTGYGNPRVDELIAAIDAEIVTYLHDVLVEKVWRVALDDIALLPLHHQVLVWALREDLELPIDPRGFPWFQIARLVER
jgi:peptide/nickel transport system substrate-binding protein